MPLRETDFQNGHANAGHPPSRSNASARRTSVYTAFARIVNVNGASFHVGNATETGTGDKAFNLGVVHDF